MRGMIVGLLIQVGAGPFVGWVLGRLRQWAAKVRPEDADYWTSPRIVPP
jgi:hypothetical protein